MVISAFDCLWRQLPWQQKSVQKWHIEKKSIHQDYTWNRSAYSTCSDIGKFFNIFCKVCAPASRIARLVSERMSHVDKTRGECGILTLSNAWATMRYVLNLLCHLRNKFSLEFKADLLHSTNRDIRWLQTLLAISYFYAAVVQYFLRFSMLWYVDFNCLPFPIVTSHNNAVFGDRFWHQFAVFGAIVLMELFRMLCAQIGHCQMQCWYNLDNDLTCRNLETLYLRRQRMRHACAYYMLTQLVTSLKIGRQSELCILVSRFNNIDHTVVLRIET